ncbi:MAG: anthrax toxin-like adenylyl cyclase domain-containing protein [Planctomycetota bacterium]
MPHSYDDATKKHLTQGMTAKDLDATARVCDKRGEIIVFRATGPWPRKYIETDKCPTKDMGVKGKSSTWGPMAGLVPVLADFSKAMKAEDVKKGNEANKKALDGKKVVAMHLSLTEAMLDRLLTEKYQDDKTAPPRTAISVLKKPDGDPLRIYIFCEKRDGSAIGTPKDWVFFGKRAAAKDEFEIYHFLGDDKAYKTLLGGGKPEREAVEKTGKPLEVLARPGNDNPMTGDYDLMFICPPWADWGTKDKRSDNFMDDPKYEARMKAFQTEIDPRMAKTFEDAFKAAEKIREAASDAKKYKGFLKGKVDIERQIKGKEAAFKAGQDSMKIVCSGGCIDLAHDNDPLEFRPDDESCRVCKKPAMVWLVCAKGCKGDVKDKAGKPKPYVFKPTDEKCPKCQGPPVSAKRSMRDFEDGDTVGNVTLRVLEVIAALNKEMGATEFNRRVHHNQEAGRFHAPADITEAFPLTVIQPNDPVLQKKWKFRLAIIDDLEDLKTYLESIFELGWFVPLNHAWDIKNLNKALVALDDPWDE